MRIPFTIRIALLLPLLAVTASCALSAQLSSTSTRRISAVTQYGGFSLSPAGTAEQAAGDLAPVQLFQIHRPGDQRVVLGRLFTSCACVRLESPSQVFESGEPAILSLRNVHPTPPSGQTYAIYVQITSPIRTTLRLNTFMQSSQFIPAAPGEAPTRGNIVADGVLPPASDSTSAAPDDTPEAVPAATTAEKRREGDIEVIVPKADKYIEDTSEYTLRKKEEAGEMPAAAGKGDDDTEESNAETPEAAADDLPAAEKADSATDKHADALFKEVTQKIGAPLGEAEKRETAIEETAAMALDAMRNVEEHAVDTVEKASASARARIGEELENTDHNAHNVAAAAEKAAVKEMEEIQRIAEATEKEIAKKAELSGGMLAEDLANTEKAVTHTVRKAADTAEKTVSGEIEELRRLERKATGKATVAADKTEDKVFAEVKRAKEATVDTMEETETAIGADGPQAKEAREKTAEARNKGISVRDAGIHSAADKARQSVPDLENVKE